jgi:hypothetical protein
VAKSTKAAAASPDTHIGSKRRLNIALDATMQMEALFNALLEQGCAIEDVDDSSVIKALAFRGVALSQVLHGRFSATTRRPRRIRSKTWKGR